MPRSHPASARPGIRYPWPEPPAAGTATEVAAGILWMRLPLPMALDHVNVYALDDGAGWTVVDTGFDTSKTREMWQALMVNDKRRHNEHQDHGDGLAFAKGRWGRHADGAGRPG